MAVATADDSRRSAMFELRMTLQIWAGDSFRIVHTRSATLSAMPSALFQFNRMLD
jgi:hypothetical protein